MFTLGKIEAAQLVIEDAGVMDGKGGLARGQYCGESKGGLLFLLVECDGGCLLVACGGDGGRLECELESVQGDVICWFGEGDVDGLSAGKGRVLEVRRESQRVMPGKNISGKALRLERWRRNKKG